MLSLAPAGPVACFEMLAAGPFGAGHYVRASRIPDGIVFLERLLAFVDPREVLVIGGLFGQNLCGDRLELQKDVLRDLVGVHACFLEARDHGAVLVLAFSQTTRDGRGADRLDQSFLSRRRLFPFVLVDQHVLGREGLVPAGEEVVLHDLIEAEDLVDGGHRELGRVDRAFFQRLEQLAARHHGDAGAQTLHHLAAETSKSDLETLIVREALDRLCEPARRFRPDDPAELGVHVEALVGVDFLQHVVAAAIVVPAGEGPGLQAEGYGCKERNRRHLALAVTDPCVARLDLAVADRLQDVERGHQLAGLIDAHLNAAVGRLGELFGHPRRRRAQTGQIRGKCDRHFPTQVGGHCRERCGGKSRRNSKASDRGFHYAPPKHVPAKLQGRGRVGHPFTGVVHKVDHAVRLGFL